MTTTRRDFIAALTGGAALLVLPGAKPKPVDLGEGRVSKVYRHTTVYEDVFVGVKVKPVEDGYYHFYLQAEEENQQVENMVLLATAGVYAGQDTYVEFMVTRPPRRWSIYTEFKRELKT